MRRSTAMKINRAVPVLAIGAALAAGIAACGSSDDNKDKAAAPTATASAPSTQEQSAAQAGDIKIAFSAPAADHGWIKAVSDDAKAEAKALGIDMTVNDSATTTADQADQITTMIQSKPDALVVLPNEGGPLTPIAQKAM